MESLLVMTIIGADRPGLVESVASAVAKHGGNWLESRMSRLGGHFAGILRVQVSGERQQSLAAALKNLAAQGLTVIVHPDQPSEAAHIGELRQLEIMGQDRPGIISQISSALASEGVNVEDLHTECSSAAMSGESLFTARARIFIPERVNVTELRRKLEKIGEDLIVDVSIKEVESDTALS